MSKNLVLILNASQEYIKHTGEDEKKYAYASNFLFEAISNTYIPLIKMLESLEKDSVDFKLNLVLSPVLCTLLDDPVVQSQYISWLDEKILFGQKEIQRCSENPKLLQLAKYYFEKYQEDKLAFESYKQRIVRKFHEYQKKGLIEILATCGTDIFLPHYSDLHEIMNAQVESGIYAYRSFFGDVAEGFWLPQKGYCSGVEKVLKSYGLSYTILDARSFLFSEKEPKNGIFSPARFDNTLVCFGSDYKTDSELYGENGFSSNKVYRNEIRDLGFMLPAEDLEPIIEKGGIRYSMGYKYWNKSNIGENELGDALDSENVYSVEDAIKQIDIDASSYLTKKSQLLTKAAALLPEEKDVSLVVTIDTNKLRSSWNEGILWLESVIRKLDSFGLKTELAKVLAKDPFVLPRVKPYLGSSSGAGYGEDLVSSKNSWMMRFIKKASQRMVDLADRFPDETGLKARLLNLGAKELMFAESVGWAKMIDNDEYPEYAEMRFKQSVNDFTAVFDALGSNTVSTEWLTSLEKQHQIFSWMNYRIFSRKF